MAEQKNKTLEKARIEMNYLTGDEEVRRLAELREKWEMDYNSGIGHARREGIKQGIKEQTVAIAKKLKEQNIDIDIICKTTGLTKEQVMKL